MKDRDVERIARMPRKEINSEILHLWTEQDQICKENTELKAKLELAIEQRDEYVERCASEYGFRAESRIAELNNELDRP